MVWAQKPKNSEVLRGRYVHSTSMWLKIVQSQNYFTYMMSKTEAEWRRRPRWACQRVKGRYIKPAVSRAASCQKHWFGLWSHSWHTCGVCTRLSFCPCGFDPVAHVVVVSFGNTVWQLWVIWFIRRWPIKITARHFELRKLEQSPVHKCSKAFDKTDLPSTNRRNKDGTILFHYLKVSNEGDLQVSTRHYKNTGM